MVAKPHMVYNHIVGKSRALIALILLGGLVFPRAALAQDKKTIVVLPFTGGNLSKAELKDLTLVFEASLSKVATLQVIDQAQREKVLAYLNPELLTCNDPSCAITIGKALSAATVVLGTIVPASGTLSVAMRVITVRTGKSIRTDSEAVASAAELPHALRLLASALFGAPLASSPGEEALTEAQEKQQRLRALESLREDLQDSIAQVKVKRRNAQTWGWVSLGFGAACATLSGVSWYLSDLAYQNYLNTSDTEEAARYRSQVVMWDSIMLGSAGAGVLSVGISIPIFLLSPDARAETNELKRVESEMASLAGTGGKAP